MPDFNDGYIYVDFSHMDNTADDLVQQTRAIAQTVADMDMELNTLKDTWLGDDRDAYNIKQTAWNNAVAAMEQMLTAHAGVLTDVSDNYRYSGNSLTEMWQSVRVVGS
ncbi:WXG100 family type VII secretion target [Streptomyces sp. NPDC001177]